MLEPMVKVHLVGHRRRLDATLTTLHGLRLLHLIDVTDDASVRLPPLAVDDAQHQEIQELRLLRSRLAGLLALLPASLEAPPDAPAPLDLERLRSELAEAGPEIERLTATLDELETEREVLPRHVQSLGRLVPLLAETTELAGYETELVVLDARHGGILAELNAHLTELLSGNFEIISNQVDPQTVGAVLVFPRTERARVQALLGAQQLSRVRLPRRFEGIPLRQAIEVMRRRLAGLPDEIDACRQQLADLVRSHPDWTAAARWLGDRLDQLGVIGRLGATPHTFCVSGWVPRRHLHDLRQALEREVGREVLVEESTPGPADRPPVLMANPSSARPFEMLVRLLALPRYGSLDPTRLMMVFLPLFFGMMLGDMGYGLLLLAAAGIVAHRFRVGTVADLARVMALSAGWSVIWGVVYGELFGDLGRRLWGMEPLWINREEALGPLLVFAVAIGAAHVTLGLVLGVWQAARLGERRRVGERLAILAALVGLFGVVAVAADRLPDAAVTPSVTMVVVGLVVLIALEGPLGLLTAPLELIGAVGNILSYLRIAAIGLASVYLARVANELGATGPLWLGLVVAALFHALNLALGAFSPTIQALRLHYVEFFGKFVDEEGGEPFHPFGGDRQPVAAL